MAVTLVLARVVTIAAFVSGSQDFLAPMPIPANLLSEVGGVFGLASMHKRVEELEASFHPLYLTLPKDDQGRLAHATVCYALHRFFTQQHGWSVHGLDPNGGAWNGSSVLSILGGRVPTLIHNLFDDRLNHGGLDLHELSVLAVTLEHLVRIETTQRVEASYSGLKLSMTDDLQSEQEVDRVLEMNFLIYMFERNLENASWVSRVRNPSAVYPGWSDTQVWMKDTRQNLAYAKHETTNPFRSQPLDFQYVMHVAEAINDRHGQYHKGECRDVKDVLVAREHKGTGRIRLPEFYGIAIAGDWRFSETVEFLRQLGALDEETDPSDPRVIIPNYLYGKSNCMAGSKFYSVCCLDECEGLLGRLGATFLSPEVEPARLATAVALLPSSTVVAPRNLSGALLQRLESIAALHDGTVPLHSRLFLQFMHHAFPRECRFPHLSGTINPKTSKQWKEETGAKATMTVEAIKAAWGEASPAEANEVAAEEDVQGEDDLDQQLDLPELNEEDEVAPWSHTEELLVGHTSAAEVFEWGRLPIMLLAIVSFGFALVEACNLKHSPNFLARAAAKAVD